MARQIDSSEVRLWCAFFKEIRDQALLEQYRGLLSEDEERRRSRFVLSRDRHRYLVTRALVRTVLSRYADVAPTQWTFASNAFGRPEVSNDDADARDLSFNISHTNSLIVLGLARRHAIGVDTEDVRARRAPIEIAERFFAPEEVAALNALPVELQQQRFFEYWTLKECYVKARARGLTIAPDKLRLRFIGDRHIVISINGDQGDSPARWYFWQFTVGDHLSAVCAERTGNDVPRLVVKKIVPLGAEVDLEARNLRTSV